MDNVFSKGNLLLVAAALAAFKFMLLPLLSWQSAKVAELSLKSVHHHKISEIVMDQSAYKTSAERSKSRVSGAAQRFYADDSQTKLLIQKEVEKVFELNQLEINGFDWVIDSTDSLRVLRAKVFFSGSTEYMIRTFWDLSRLPRWVSQVESNQQIKRFSENSLGLTKGNVTLEFYALPDDFFEVGFT